MPWNANNDDGDNTLSLNNILPRNINTTSRHPLGKHTHTPAHVYKFNNASRRRRRRPRPAAPKMLAAERLPGLPAQPSPVRLVSHSQSRAPPPPPPKKKPPPALTQKAQ